MTAKGSCRNRDESCGHRLFTGRCYAVKDEVSCIDCPFYDPDFDPYEAFRSMFIYGLIQRHGVEDISREPFKTMQRMITPEELEHYFGENTPARYMKMMGIPTTPTTKDMFIRICERVKEIPAKEIVDKCNARKGKKCDIIRKEGRR